MVTSVRQQGASFHHLPDSGNESSLPDPSRSLRMYSSELSSKASSSAPADTVSITAGRSRSADQTSD